MEGAASVSFEPAPPSLGKGFVVATVALPGGVGGEVDVVSVHLDFLRKRTRREQILLMAEELGERTNPLIVLGDMNCWWDRRNDALALLVDALGVRACEPEARRHATFPSRRPRWRLDWVLISPELEFASHVVVEDRVSDHLGVVAEVELAAA
jgi:endonuclease/exonuclease/phosphatase family metal-dependent hydrolase